MNPSLLRRLVYVAGAAVCSGTLAAQSPNASPHGELRLPCATCHTSAGWSPARVSAKFRHADYGPPLVGAHADASCTACHRSLAFAGAATACADCHEDVHRGELGMDCARCHTPRSFLDRAAMTQTHRLTRFPLDGAHRTADCEACHVPSQQGRLAFVNRSTECVECHGQAYTAATNPDHVSGGFSRACATCHTSWGWDRARFDHQGTGFPLTGAHRALSCATCHAGGWSGVPTACVSCHQADYDATANPDHQTLAFPTDCVPCHTTSTWAGGSFTQHDAQFFPIFSGKHRGKWSSCSDCHTSTGSYALFTCTQCHSQRSMDEHHKEISGYGPTPADCLRCHATGRKP